MRIRYDAPSNRYEVMADARGWIALVDDPGSDPLPGNPNLNFRFAGEPNSFFLIRAHYNYVAPEAQYRYSNLADWVLPAAGGQSGVGGTTAFGIPTAAGSVPVSGTASYNGSIEGVSTVTGPWGWDGETVATWVGGSVSLNFDFGAGSLTGELHPYLDADKRYDLGTLAFANTVFGVGSQTFSGTFATSVSGPNSFSGQLTGPHAEELIGKWAFPFISPIDASPQSATGAWIAKRP